jgi:hypothetical protein
MTPTTLTGTMTPGHPDKDYDPHHPDGDYDTWLPSIPAENGGINYLERGEVRPGEQGVGLQVTATITTNFLILIGIFFPSVTGSMGWGISCGGGASRVGVGHLVWGWGISCGGAASRVGVGHLV